MELNKEQKLELEGTNKGVGSDRIELRRRSDGVQFEASHSEDVHGLTDEKSVLLEKHKLGSAATSDCPQTPGSVP